MCEKPILSEDTPRPLWRIVHEDEKGAVSLETVLIIAAVALPILIFLIQFVWPQIKEFVQKMLKELFEEAEQV